MKLTAAFAIWPQLVLAAVVGVLPTLRDVLKSPSLLVRPRRLSRVMFANVWAVFGPFVDRKFRGNKEALITPNAHGVVLDIGAGEPGTTHTRSRVALLLVARRSGVYMYVAERADAGL